MIVWERKRVERFSRLFLHALANPYVCICDAALKNSHNYALVTEAYLIEYIKAYLEENADMCAKDTEVSRWRLIQSHTLLPYNLKKTLKELRIPSGTKMRSMKRVEESICSGNIQTARSHGQCHRSGI